MAGAAELDFKGVLKDHIIGTINHLKTTQADCSDSLVLDTDYICNKDIQGEKRVNGGWDSIISPTFMKAASSVSFLDSNMFVTAHVLYPFWFLQLDETAAVNTQQMKDIAVTGIDAHRRGGGYSFWPEIGPSLGNVNRIGPLNLSTLLLSSQISLADKLGKTTGLSVIPRDVKWLDVFFDRDNKEIGMDALFSVPNDNDDTALAIITKYYHDQDKILAGNGDVADLKETISLGENINRFVDTFELRKLRMVDPSNQSCKDKMANGDRDQLVQDVDFLRECSLDDPREHWRYKAYADSGSYTGAYMTWAYDETGDIYADPEAGVIMTGQNSVDCVVIANALYAISLSGLKNNHEYKKNYENSCNIISNIMLDENDNIRTDRSGRDADQDKESPVWRHCGLFYPSHMLFPYMISRAVRDGNACTDLTEKTDQERFDKAMTSLMKEIVKEQDQDDENKSSGEWYETMDSTIALPSALGAVTLLNLGEKTAQQAEITSNELSTRIEAGIQAFINKRKIEDSQNDLPNYSLPGGTFFGGGTVNEIALWKSAPFTAAVSLEAATKYIMNWQKNADQNGNLSPRKKLVISDVREENGNYTFSDSILNIDDQKFKKQYYIDEYLQDSSEISANFTQLLLSSNIKKEHLDKPKKGKVFLDIEGGYSARPDGNYGVVGVELTVGETFKEGSSRVAYYKVKLNAIGYFNPNGPNYNISARFLGVSTDTDFIKDEIGLMPVRYIKEGDIQEFQMHLAMATIQAPVLKLGNKARLNIYAVGQLIGYMNKINRETDDILQRHTVSLVDLNIGVVLEYGRFLSFKLSAGSNLGLSYQKYRGVTDFNMATPYNFAASMKIKVLKDYFISLGYQYNQDPGFRNSQNFFTVGFGVKF